MAGGIDEISHESERLPWNFRTIIATNGTRPVGSSEAANGAEK